MGVCNCSMFCCTLLYVHSSIAVILMGKRELVALLNLSSWCLVMVERLFLAVPQGCLQFVIVVFPDHTHYFCSHPSSLCTQLVKMSVKVQNGPAGVAYSEVPHQPTWPIVMHHTKHMTYSEAPNQKAWPIARHHTNMHG